MTLDDMNQLDIVQTAINDVERISVSMRDMRQKLLTQIVAGNIPRTGNGFVRSGLMIGCVGDLDRVLTSLYQLGIEIRKG